MSTSKASEIPSLTSERIQLLTKELEEHGVAVLPGVLTDGQCNEYVTELHQWLKQFGENGFPATKNSIIHNYNLAHSPVAWKMRLHAAPVFESLWGTEKLVSSIDGMAIGHPPELGLESFITGDQLSLTLHHDQGPGKVGLHAYQGAVYLEEALEDDWCFVIMDKSHLLHQEYYKMRTGPAPSREYCRLTEEEIKWYMEMGCPIRRISVPKGGMVLWDSRTVHAGARPEKNRRNPGRWRFVSFACMVPAFWASPEEMEMKRTAFRKMLCSRHWPAQGFELFAKNEQPAELNAVNELPEIALTERARLLAGDLAYPEDGKPNGPPKPISTL